MSRSHKTMPYQQKLRKGILKTVEHHDHRNGACDIEGHYAWHPGGRCYHDLHFTGTYVCCCRLCHAPTWKGGRHPRRVKKRALATWQDEYYD